MNKYEVTFILRTEDEKFKNGLELVKSDLDKIKAKIQKEEDLGNRDLAYLIKKQARAHYIYMELEAEPSEIAGITRNMNLNVDLLKYLFVKKS